MTERPERFGQVSRYITSEPQASCTSVREHLLAQSRPSALGNKAEDRRYCELTKIFYLCTLAHLEIGTRR
jgi:hypothetical protein